MQVSILPNRARGSREQLAFDLFVLQSNNLPGPQYEVRVVSSLHPHELHHGVDEGRRRVAEVRAKLPDRAGRREGRRRRRGSRKSRTGGGVAASGSRTPADCGDKWMDGGTVSVTWSLRENVYICGNTIWVRSIEIPRLRN